jgi:hypothetical protein
MNNLTREELKIKLASKENKLAGKLIDIIRSEETSDKLLQIESLLSKTDEQTIRNAEVFFKRDPSHPRSRYMMEHVLDSCFETKMIIVNPLDNQPIQPQEVTDGLSQPNQELVKVFKLLLRRGFSPGENSYRGSLTHHILNSCFYYANPNNPRELEKKKYALELAKILIGEGKFDVNRYAAHSYHWVNSVENLDTIIKLGANPKGNSMIDCALSYVACSPNSKEAPNDRTKVISKLLSLGAIAKQPLEDKISGRDIKIKLQEYGLLSQIEYQIFSHKISEESTCP